MSDLVIRSDALHSQARRVRSIAADLAAAHSQADAAAAAVGHQDLARTVRDFGSQWDIHRQRFIDDVTTLADVFDAINNTMADLEGNMASHMRGAARQATAAMPSPAASGGQGR
ncbi:hypothetical protein [Demequina lutea]|uniref:WXG100 family type VII secretion target n=1 Tax=Demequina lutea TaxID=431489 RepID=A0A7Y9Z6X2_9MICO|nr:hypothetical protein [Demequina lutea]NYI39927.1 hypothetical protein [Demequina lutea]